MRLETPAVANIVWSMETSMEETISLTGGIGEVLMISILLIFSLLMLLLLVSIVLLLLLLLMMLTMLLLLLLLLLFITAPNWVIKELLLNDKDDIDKDGLTISATMRTRPYFCFASVEKNCAKSSNRSSFIFSSILAGSMR